MAKASNGPSLKLSLLLAAATLSVSAGKGQTQVANSRREQSALSPSFAVVRIKLSSDSEADDWGIGLRGRNFWAVHVTAAELIEWAYGVSARQIEHAADWVGTEHFDVDGLPDPDVRLSRQDYRVMLQTALSERFSFRFHSAEKLLPLYVLSVAVEGLRIVRPADQGANSTWGVHRGWFSVQNMTFDDAARVMQRTIFDRPVLDRTGLKDKYSFILKWRGDETQFSQMQGLNFPQEAGTEDVDDIYTAARKQLGIQIEARKAPVPTMIVESISQPSPN